MKLTKKKLNITGMHCNGCADRITKVLNELNGVRSAEVSLDDGQAVVAYDEGQTGFSELKEAIEEAGYNAEPQ